MTQLTTSGAPVSSDTVPTNTPTSLGGWVSFGASLAYEPVVLKATGDCVESAGVLEAELFGRLSESDPGLIDDQGKELVTTTTRAGLRPAGAHAGRGRGGCASARVRRRGLLFW